MKVKKTRLSLMGNIKKANKFEQLQFENKKLHKKIINLEHERKLMKKVISEQGKCLNSVKFYCGK